MPGKWSILISTFHLPFPALHTRAEPFDEKFVGEASFVESVKLPPIVRAATRPRDRSTGESAEDLLEGHRAKQFEQQIKQRTVVQPPVADDQKRPAHKPRKMVVPHLPSRENVADEDEKCVGPFRERKDLVIQRRRAVEKSPRHVPEPKHEEKRASDGNAKKARTKQASPRKERSSDEEIKKRHLITPSPEKCVKSDKHNRESRPREPDTVRREERVDVPLGSEPAEAEETVNQQHKAWRDEVHVGDMVALRVPDKLYIKGQPCLGKVTCLADRTGFITVHYYTGSYSGSWRPMMSRTSPYLRRVPRASVLCKFRLSSDGRMSPVTQEKVKRTVDARGRCT